MLIPFEPVISFTIASLVVWYMLLILCGATGAMLAIMVCESINIIKVTIGILYGMGVFYGLSWLFQSRTGMEFAQVLKVVVN